MRDIGLIHVRYDMLLKPMPVGQKSLESDRLLLLHTNGLGVARKAISLPGIGDIKCAP
ncbi:hypothetical protein KSX_14490 [Ktedonospora formicarum]|uniref:Uncharacterized protein n=1 Tax=Ktedonospora formicarum TaxID=2778364 RepID=A0A8J3MQZ6_9CHLR|nr:hypothetical protein KSX_14490 [Ktedonospora formicarum]